MRVLRGLVLSLVLANVLYYLWARGVAPQPPVPGPASVPRLRLASEASQPSAERPSPAAASAASAVSTASTANSTVSVASAASVAMVSAARRCLSIGPFLDAAEAVRAAATLRSGGYRPRQRVVTGDVWSDVWVYLPLPASAPALARMRSKLKSAGIEDVLQMPGPKGTSVLSLGLFSEPDRADAQIKRVRSLGFEPRVADRQRSGDVYWVDVDLKPKDPNLNAADIDPGRARIVRLQVVTCPGT